MENNGQPSLPLEELEGTLDHFVYENEESGYCVAQFACKGQTRPVTVVGALMGMQSGETVHLRGQWVRHPTYGQQFKVQFYRIVTPASAEAIRKYLGSGMIKGIGPVTAGRIVGHFGIKALDVLDQSPERLLEVHGVGEMRAGIIREAWKEQCQIKEIMLFLQDKGIRASLAVKIYKQYGEASITTVRMDPYRLARDIYGIGFKTADQIARQLGLPVDSPARIQAGLLYAMNSLSNAGHCYARHEQLIEEATRLLEQPAETCEAQVGALLSHYDLIEEEGALYLPSLAYAERGAAARLRALMDCNEERLRPFQTFNWQTAFTWLDQVSEMQLTDLQKEALRMALLSRASILTGGPGTGKTTIMRSLIRLLNQSKCSVLLAAPTGRAAKRLSEATGMEAKTIHRLLEYSPSQESGFTRTHAHPLDADLIIIDETSMVDILLMNHLLDAIPPGSHLLLVGDMDQLPSVGPGNVLRDLIQSAALPVTRLSTIFRQAEGSFIITNAHRINQGEMPIFSQESQDFFLFIETDPQKAADRVVELVLTRIPARFGFDAQSDIQVLAPMHRGEAGVSELNQRLQDALNPLRTGMAHIKHGSRNFREGDRVMQLRNDYERMVFNGDLGRIREIDLEMHTVSVEIDGRRVNYEYAQLDDLMHAYAASIHKAQGSEFPVVVIPLLTQHYRMLQRNLLYTAVTRARKLVVLVGDRKAIGMAVRNKSIAQRNTRLAHRLR
jgi:exodeoxyribonuclease V alpha subunit